MSVTPFEGKAKSMKEVASLAMAHQTLRSINCPLSPLRFTNEDRDPLYPCVLSRVGLACTVVQPVPCPDIPPDATGAPQGAPTGIRIYDRHSERGHEPRPNERKSLQFLGPAQPGRRASVQRLVASSTAKTAARSPLSLISLVPVIRIVSRPPKP